MPSPSRVAESEVPTIASILYVLPVVPPETQNVIMLFLLVLGELSIPVVAIVKSLTLPSIFSEFTLAIELIVSDVASKLLNSIENFLCSDGCLQSLSFTLSLSGAPTTLWGIMNSEGTFGLGQSEIGAYTTPTGYYGFVLSKNIGFEASKNASVFMFVRENADTVIAPFGAMRSIELDRNINNRIDVVPKGVLAVLPPITDVGFMAKSITGTTALSVDFEILLVREDLVNI
jgi:hypothetical protein